MSGKRQLGFTLVELMISTAIFSVIMLTGLYTYLSISRTYTKGISIIRTQDVVRRLESEITTQLQYSAVEVRHVSNVTVEASLLGSVNYTGNNSYVPVYQATCLGNKIYVYSLNVVENGNGSAMRIYDLGASTADSGCPDNYSGNEDSMNLGSGEVILNKGTRVLEFDINQIKETVAGIEQSTPLYQVSISLLYEPEQSQAVPFLINAPTDSPMDFTKWQCKSNVAGSEYCAIVKLSTVVYKRL